MNSKYFQTIGRRGGKIGGKATGERKRRSPEHYKRIQRMALEARRKKREGRYASPPDVSPLDVPPDVPTA